MQFPREEELKMLTKEWQEDIAPIVLGPPVDSTFCFCQKLEQDITKLQAVRFCSSIGLHKRQSTNERVILQL